MSNIKERIGLPALLEQTAEACAELNKACLKLARILRNENYTPCKMTDIVYNLHEEIADILVCIEELANADVLKIESITKIQDAKKTRWYDRTSNKRMKDEDLLKDFDDFLKTFGIHVNSLDSFLSEDQVHDYIMNGGKK